MESVSSCDARKSSMSSASSLMTKLSIGCGQGSCGGVMRAVRAPWGYSCRSAATALSARMSVSTCISGTSLHDVSVSSFLLPLQPILGEKPSGEESKDVLAQHSPAIFAHAGHSVEFLERIAPDDRDDAEV